MTDDNIMDVQAKIEEDRLRDFLFAILKIHSPSGVEKNMAECLLNEFDEYSPIIDEVGNVIVRIPGEGESILWSAHMDVVSPCTGLEPVLEDGVIKNAKQYVLGIDNKAAIACMREAVVALKETTHRPIDIVFTVEEETTNKGSIKLNLDKISAKRGVIFDMAAPVGTYVTEASSYYDLDWIVQGKTSHTKKLEKADVYAWPVLRDIMTASPFGVQEGRTNINWARMEGGMGRNTITEKFHLRGELRSFSEEHARKFMDDQKKLYDKLEEKYPEVDISMDHNQVNHSYSFSDDDPWLLEIKEAMKRVDVAPQKVDGFGISDANEFRYRGLNVIALGYGAENTHSVDEKVKMVDLLKVTEILISLATN